MREIEHVILGAEVQAARRTGLDAGGLEAFADAIGAQRALEDAIVLRVHLRNVEGASRDAVAAADAIGLLEVYDAIGVLHDGAVRGAPPQAAPLPPLPALVFS